MTRLCELENKIDALQAKYDAVEAKLNSAEKVVWQREPEVEGLRWDFWNAATDDGSAAPHGPIADIFNGNPSVGGTPGHVNGAPDSSGTHNDFTLNDINMVGNPPANLGPQQWRLYGYLTFPADGLFRDGNGNTGETGQFWLGEPADCCKPLNLELVAERTDNTTGGQRGIIEPNLPVTAGEKRPFVVLMSDVSAFGGFAGQWSGDGGATWQNVAVCQNLPKLVPVKIPFCQTPGANQQCEPPTPCCTDFQPKVIK